MNAVRVHHMEDLLVQNHSHPGIPDTAQEKELNHFLELAAFACNCPMAAISFNDRGKQKLKATRSLASSFIPGTVSFCSDVILQEDVLVLSHTSKEKQNSSAIQFYAGAPIMNTEGRRSGSLCVMDTRPDKEFTEQQKNALKTIAHLVACLADLKVNKDEAIHHAVEAEKRMTHLAISEQDSERGFIAHKLQENFAQTLAATKLYLEFAVNSKDKKDHFIQKSKDNIVSVIDDIRYLCKSMVPATLGNPDTGELLRDMIAEWEKSNNIYVDFICGTSLRGMKNHTGFTIFHIIQQQLKLATSCNARKAEISILEQNGFVLYFTIKDHDFVVPGSQKEIFINNIAARVAMINGEMTLETIATTNDVMRISIPDAFIK